MKTIPVEFSNKRGEVLAGRLDLPEDERPLAYALFAHCFTCGKNLKAITHIGRALTAEKLAVLRFDFSGVGESEGDFSKSHFTSNVEDLLSAADWLATEYQSPQLLIGHSFGGAAVLQAAQQIKGVRAVATLAAPYDPNHVRHLFSQELENIEAKGEAEVSIAGRRFNISREFLDDLDAQRVETRLADLKAALLVLHSPIDKIVGIDNAAQIYRAAKHPKSFIGLDGADHLLSKGDDARYAGSMIAAWACRYLQLESKPGIKADVVDNRVTVRTGNQGFYTELFANGHALVADEPKTYGGTDLGPSPYEYLLSALGACTTMTVQMYAQRKKWPLDSAVVRLSHQKIHAVDCQSCEEKEGKIDRFERELELQGDLNDEQRQRLLEIAERCPVHRTLHATVEVVTRLKE
jgi:uncharacterized OsmC-like protein/alpha/beta superfamily hydrolase